MNPTLAKYISKIPFVKKNFQLLPNMSGIAGPANIPRVESNAHHPRNFMIPLQLERIRQDITTWRNAITEAENAYYPHRFLMQQMFIDKVLEGHTMACMSARKDLTLLKDFKIGKKSSEGQWVENEEATKLFTDKKWFTEVLDYILDAQFYGYSLIQLGDLVNKGKDLSFSKTTILKRWHVSPDRHQLVQIPRQTWGINFLDDGDKDADGVPFADWMIYVDTPSDTGASICGYGLLYNVALYGIILRNNLSHNADYTQMFAAPYRHIKTPAKFDSEEYKALEQSASQMGSFGYLLTSDQEVVEFIQGNQGTGFQSYADLEKRCQGLISKLILGHANAIDAQATALGGGSAGKKVQDEDSTPEGKAKAVIEKKQDKFTLNVLNDTVYPKLKNLGFPLNDDECFYTLNDKEDFEIRKKEDAANQVTATVAQTMSAAGLKMDAKYYEERTGIPTTDAPDPTPQPFGNKDVSDKIKMKLKNMYNAVH